MRNKINDFIFAIHSLFTGEDGLFYVTNGRMSRGSVGKYRGPLNDRMNLSNDMRNIYSDVNIAMRGYGKSTAQ